MMMYSRLDVLKKERAVSIVMPWSCSSESASSRKAYSNSLPGAQTFFADSLEFSFGQRIRIGQEPADHRAFAVVHVAHDDDVHLLFGGFRAHIYPSRRSSSSPCLPSCKRPERSAIFLSLPLFNSAMMSSTFLEVLWMGAWHGAQPKLR